MSRFVSDPKLSRILRPVKWLDLLVGLAGVLIVVTFLGCVLYGLTPADLVAILQGWGG